LPGRAIKREFEAAFCPRLGKGGSNWREAFPFSGQLGFNCREAFPFLGRLGFNCREAFLFQESLPTIGAKLGQEAKKGGQAGTPRIISKTLCYL
jgi:hypothetical protein